MFTVNASSAKKKFSRCSREAREESCPVVVTMGKNKLHHVVIADFRQFSSENLNTDNPYWAKLIALADGDLEAGEENA